MKTNKKAAVVSVPVKDGATVMIGGKPLVAKSAKNKVGASPVKVFGKKGQPNTITPPTAKIKKMTVKQVIEDDHFGPDEQWEKVEGHDGMYEAYAVTLTDGGMAKFTGFVQFRGEWIDLRTFKEMKDEEDTFYLSSADDRKDHIVLKVII